jgi:carboxylesterase type B
MVSTLLCRESCAERTLVWASIQKWLTLSAGCACLRVSIDGNATGRSLPHPEAINATQWGPVVDGTLLSAAPVELLRRGPLPMPTVPVLLGSNADEGSTFLNDDYRSAQELAAFCNHTFGAR